MTSGTPVVRSLMVYGLCLPLALFLGYMLSDPLAYASFSTVGLILFCLAIPLFLRWHHPWLVVTWNMSAVIFFLPGRPPLWMAMTAISLGVVTLQFTLDREKRILSVPTLTWPLLALAFVVLGTAKLTGGLGLRSLGSEVQGGKRYFLILGSILGYFAIASKRIPPHRAMFYVTLFFLSGATMAIGDLFGVINPAFNFLFLIFPVESAAGLEITGWASTLIRSWALPFMSIGVFCTMISRYGLRGCLDLTRPWRLAVLVVFTFVGMLGGFRSMVVILVMTFAVTFYLEGLTRTRLLPAFILVFILGGSLLAAFATHLPPSIQRSLAVLPIEVDPLIKMDAQASNEWRIRMWKDLVPQIPNYLLLGKGYSFSGEDIDIILANFRAESPTAGSEMVADYHNGPLSLIIPLGLPGTFAFLWFVFAALKVMYRNYKYGEPELVQINRLMFAYFVARVIFFFGVFGSLYSDLAMFTGLVGLSVSLNGGVAKPAVAPQPEYVVERFRPAPALGRPVTA